MTTRCGPLRSVSVGVCLLAMALVALTASARPSATLPADAPYVGAIDLEIDATDLDRRIFRARQKMPVKPGALTLHYAEWIPGNHAPRGQIELFAGLTVRGNGRRIVWTRDPLDVYSFHLDVPAGVQVLELEFQYVSPQDKEQGRIVMTPEILGLRWETVLLYPGGHRSNRIRFTPSVTLPAGWHYATALDTQSRAGDTVHFRTVTLETLVDSPLFAGKFFSRVDLDPGAAVPVHLNVFADTAQELDMSPAQLAVHRRMVRETLAVFGPRPFDRYDFLFAISDHFTTIGIEHHRSSENALVTGYFRDEGRTLARRNLLAHEFTHSWNGKFRRPAGLLTPHLNVPMQDSLLWVYEGQTTFWDLVLAVRSGLWTAQTARDALAVRVATLQDKRAGREWRDLQDTTNQPIITARRPQPWASWQRAEDYYIEGGLLWLDVDLELRKLTDGKRSLDDFARAFFGAQEGSYVPVPYVFDDVVAALNGVAAFDWARFLRERLESNHPAASLQGLTRAGWRQVYKEEPTEFLRRSSALREEQDFSYSVGVVLNKEAKFSEVVWGSPAFKAGLSTAHTLVAVNGRAYRPEVLKQAISDAKSESTPLVLLVRSLDRYASVALDYAAGLRYPHLERIESSADRLTDIFQPRTR